MYRVIIDELVFKDDLKRISRHDQQRIIRAIRDKLTTSPEKFGAPLKGTLKGYWKLRAGQYRVVYEIEKEKVIVYVIAVSFRRNKEVYREAVKRQGL